MAAGGLRWIGPCLSVGEAGAVRPRDGAGRRTVQYFRGGVIVAGLFALSIASCARAIESSSAEADEDVAAQLVDETSAILAVANNSIFDVRIYVLRAGQRYRLGLVGSGTTMSFPLGRFLINREIALYAEPVGARGQQRTDAIYVRPGQEVRLELEKRLRSHTLAVY